MLVSLNSKLLFLDSSKYLVTDHLQTPSPLFGVIFSPSDNFFGNDFTNKNNTAGVIYVVRDPRNIITSVANHYQLNLEKSLDFLLDEKRFLFNTNNPNDSSEENIIT